MDVQHGDTSRPGASGTPGVKLNLLCSICSGIFARAKSTSSVFSWFHDINMLRASAANGCHFCNIILREMGPENIQSLQTGISEDTDFESGSVDKRLMAETRYHRKIGLYFLLRRSDAAESDSVAKFGLIFTGAPEELQTPNFRDQIGKSLSQARQWIERCQSSHTACKPYITGATSRSQLPTRLLALGKDYSPDIKLCETSNMTSSELSYTTLSHCWGNRIPTKLLTTNYSAFLDRISIIDLPKTFRDAVEATRSFGLEYLWIDSLCILQDSVEDWDKESNRMYMVYKNSYLNLSAVSSKDATGGLFYQYAPLSRVPCTVKIGTGSNVEWVRTSYTSGRREQRDIPLLSRAWVFQETLLPTRVLFFTKYELCWECHEAHWTEAYPDSEKEEGIPGDRANDDGIVTLREDWREIRDTDIFSRFKIWNQVVSEYSSKNLTKSSDKLVAVAGLAFDIAKGWPAVDYLAGLWSYQLSNGLLWRSRGHAKRSRFYIAPSWSWASVEGQTLTSPPDLQFSDALVEVIDVYVQLSDPSNLYGVVSDGSIRIKGPLFQAERITKENIQLFAEHFVMQLPDWKNDVDAEISWDDERFSEMFREVRAFIMPFKVFIEVGDKDLTLEGLILSPTLSQRGQYQRIGWFRIRDRLIYNVKDLSLETSAVGKTDAERVESCPASDSSMSTRTTWTQDIVMIDGCPQKPPFADENQQLTEFDTAQVLHIVREEDELLPSPPEIYPLSTSFHDTCGQSEIESQRSGDRYCNGVIDSTLNERYRDQLDADRYPNINACLTFAGVHNTLMLQLDEDSGWKQYYEESHGRGYYTIQIV